MNDGRPRLSTPHSSDFRHPATSSRMTLANHRSLITSRLLLSKFALFHSFALLEQNLYRPRHNSPSTSRRKRTGLSPRTCQPILLSKSFGSDSIGTPRLPGPVWRDLSDRVARSCLPALLFLPQNKKPGVERRAHAPFRRIRAKLDSFLACVRSEPHLGSCGFDCPAVSTTKFSDPTVSRP